MKEEVSIFSQSPGKYAEHLARLSDKEFWKHALEKAHADSVPAVTTNTDSSGTWLSCVTCEFRNGRGVFPMNALYEIVSAPPQFTLLPDVPPWVLGIVAWRGETMAVVDLCFYLTKADFSPLQERMLMIAHYEDKLLAFCVPAIGPTITIEPGQITIIEEGHHLRTDIPIGTLGIWEQGEQWNSKIQGKYTFVLDVPTLFSDITQNLEMKPPHE